MYPHCTNTVKKSFSIFPSLAGMPLRKLSLGGKYDVTYKIILPRESLVSDIPAGDRNIEKLFLTAKRLPLYSLFSLFVKH
jgi:hypothetical protein